MDKLFIYLFVYLFIPLKMSVRTNVLSAYRRLLKLSNQLPAGDKRQSAVTQIREAFKNNQNEIETTKIHELLTKAASSISYLKIVTPRTKRTDNEPQKGNSYLYFIAILI